MRCPKGRSLSGASKCRSCLQRTRTEDWGGYGCGQCSSKWRSSLLCGGAKGRGWLGRRRRSPKAEAAGGRGAAEATEPRGLLGLGGPKCRHRWRLCPESWGSTRLLGLLGCTKTETCACVAPKRCRLVGLLRLCLTKHHCGTRQATRSSCE